MAVSTILLNSPVIFFNLNHFINHEKTFAYCGFRYCYVSGM